MIRIKTSQRIARMNTNKEKEYCLFYLYYSFHSCNSLINSLTNLLICYINIRNFYLEYQIRQTVSGKLTWSHYCELLGLDTLEIKSQRMTRIKTNKKKEYCLFYLCYSFHSRNSLINSLTYSLIKTGEEIEYFV